MDGRSRLEFADVSALSSETDIGPDNPNGLMVDATRFKRGMRHLASGVSLVTTAVDGHRFGLVATSVTSVSVDPPSVLCCINRSAGSFAAIERSGHFCINVLGQSLLPLAERFTLSKSGDERFEHDNWDVLSTGSPALQGALVNLDCVTAKTVIFGTHAIFIGEVKAVRVGQSPDKPLIYHDGAYRLG